MDIEPAELTNDLIYRIDALQAPALAEGARAQHVKPHGALNNTTAKYPEPAGAVVEAILAVDPSLPLMVLPNSVIHRVADDAGPRTIREAFAGRADNPDGSLVPRAQSGSVHHDVASVVAQSLRLAAQQEMVAVGGTILTVDAQSICLHGDTPGAVAKAATVK